MTDNVTRLAHLLCRCSSMVGLPCMVCTLRSGADNFGGYDEKAARWLDAHGIGDVKAERERCLEIVRRERVGAAWCVNARGFSQRKQYNQGRLEACHAIISEIEGGGEPTQGNCVDRGVGCANPISPAGDPSPNQKVEP